MPAMDEDVVALVKSFIARVRTGRAVKAVEHILTHGHVTTDDLKALGYEHPPRAVSDVKDQGIPIVKVMVRSPSGRRMARYSLGTAADIVAGQAGRTNFSRAFRQKLHELYGDRDTITGAEHDPRALQIDHRVPFRISGDAGLGDVSAFMLLDGKSQRAKSWSCEHCTNYLHLHDPGVCRGCYWAYPESYTHVAMVEQRRAELVWTGDEVKGHDDLADLARRQDLSVSDLLKRLGGDAVERESDLRRPVQR